MDDKYAQDAFERIKNMVSEKPPVLIEIKFSNDELKQIFNKIEKTLIETAKTEPFMANIITQNILEYFVDLIKFKNQTAKQNIKSDGNVGSPIFRRVDD